MYQNIETHIIKELRDLAKHLAISLEKDTAALTKVIQARYSSIRSGSSGSTAKSDPSPEKDALKVFLLWEASKLEKLLFATLNEDDLDDDLDGLSQDLRPEALEGMDSDSDIEEPRVDADEN